MGKSLLVSIFFLSVSSLTHAQDIADRHSAFCETPEAGKEMGPKGSCKIIAVKKDIGPMFGQCSGSYKGQFPCDIVYGSLSSEGPGVLTVACGPDMAKPVVKEELEAEVIVYEIFAVIKTRKGKRVLLKDNSLYTVLNSQLVSLYQTTSFQEDGTAATVHSATLELAKPVELKDFTCK